MHNIQEEKSGDLLIRAYGSRVKELLNQSDSAEWVENLWAMYTGFTAFSQEAGYDPKGHDRFMSFKELIFFFQDLERMRLGEAHKKKP